MRPWIATLLLLAICAAAAIAAYPWLEPARLLHSIHGIDVSHHQQAIRWQEVRASGVRFAYIKATEGGDFVDPRFKRNWADALSSGLRVGAYHFFTLCRPGATQAANFIRTVPTHPAALPHAIDAEHMGPCINLPTVESAAREIKVFLDRVEAHFGRRPLIYTTAEFHDTHLKGRFERERFWIRSLVLPPRFRTDAWVIWQYHNRGRRPGIVGPVDLNIAKTALFD